MKLDLFIYDCFLIPKSGIKKDYKVFSLFDKENYNSFRNFLIKNCKIDKKKRIEFNENCFIFSFEMDTIKKNLSKKTEIEIAETIYCNGYTVDVWEREMGTESTRHPLSQMPNQKILIYIYIDDIDMR